ncbi:MAG TPA: FixH family protein [Lysobacter sp.]
MNETALNNARSPWREPMVWLVAALPIASVIAGVSLLVISVRSGSADAVADPVQRTAQIQVSDLGPDERARQLQLTAIVRLGTGLVEVLPVTGEFDRTTPLRIALRHPTLASADHELLLQPTELGWRGRIALGDTHDWNLQVSAGNGEWRLRGRMPKGQRAAHMKPAVESPDVESK